MCHEVTLVDYTRVRSVTPPLTLGKQPQASLLTWVSVLFFWVDALTNWNAQPDWVARSLTCTYIRIPEAAAGTGRQGDTGRVRTSAAPGRPSRLCGQDRSRRSRPTAGSRRLRGGRGWAARAGNHRRQEPWQLNAERGQARPCESIHATSLLIYVSSIFISVGW